MLIIYTIGWIFCMIVGFVWLLHWEKSDKKHDYSMAGIFIVLGSILWPISLPALLLYLFFN